MCVRASLRIVIIAIIIIVIITIIIAQAMASRRLTPFSS